jgi:glycosyltransferase involved in cell wall biosynthesis
VTGGLHLLLTADAVGGVWQYSLDLAHGLAQRGVETTIAVLGPSPTAAQQAEAIRIPRLRLIDTGLPLDWLAPSADEVRRSGERIAALAVRLGADLVQLHAPALAAEARFSVPIVGVNHSCLASWWDAVVGGSPSGDFAWRAELAGRGLGAADVAVAPTEAFAEMTQRANRLKRRPVAVHNGRSPLLLPAAARHDFAFTAGRLWDRGKNVATLDRAAALLPVPLYAAGATAGPGGERIALANASPLGVLETAELAHWLAPRPVFVSAARYEPFGLAVLEAAAAGCPLVLSDIPTFRELWDGAAVFVEPSDAEGFAAAIGEIVGDDSVRTSKGGAAQERAARYTPAATASAMAAIYARLTGRRAPPRERAKAAA